MKALTLWEPWASLMALGEKKVETRCWSTKYRGPIAIHAAKKSPRSLGVSRFTSEFVNHASLAISKHGEFIFDGDFVLGTEGCVLAVADLVAIYPTEKVREDIGEKELVFGNYEDGRYAWFFENVYRLKRPLSAKGNRLLWEWYESGILAYSENSGIH